MIVAYVNGEKYDKWTSARVSRSIDNAVGMFTLTTDSENFAVMEGDRIEIIIDGETKLTGYVDTASGTNTDGNTSRTVTGRDALCDLVDSSLPDECKSVKSGSSLQGIISNVLKKLGLNMEIINNAGTLKPFSSIELTAGEAGSGAFEFITNLARKRGVFINSDGLGNLVLFKMSTIITAFVVKTGEFLESSVSAGTAERFAKYCCKSQLQIDGNYSEKTVYAKGYAKDRTARDSRYFEFVAEESMSSAECKARAEEEANIRRARSFEYRVKMQGHSLGGNVFDIKKGFSIKDEKLQVKGRFVIRSVDYSIDSDSGNYTDIVLAYADSYSVQAEMDQKALRKIDVAKYIREANK